MPATQHSHPTETAPLRPLRGITLKVISVLVFIVMAAMIKATSADIPPGEAVFFRSFFAIPVILVWLAMRGELSSGLRTSNPLGHVWRGFAGTGAMGLGFAGLAYLPLPEVTALGYAAPILTVVFAAIFLGEQVRAFRITAVALGVLGVMIVLWPRLSVLHQGGKTEAIGAMIVLAAAVCAALAQVTVRRMVNTEKTAAIVFWFSVTSSVLALFTIPFGWAIPTPQQAVLLVLAGLLGGVGQILLTSSYREADASLIAPFEYASMLFALLIGYVIFEEMPTAPMILGASVIIAAGVMIILRERHLGLQRQRQRKAMTP